MIGQTISHYRIIEKLGQGGMGEVYLAEDTRLDRRVALKFLAPGLAQDRESLLRFRNEAKAAARLSHPNIAGIFDVGDVDGKQYLVLEYLQGQTLRDRIQQGPLPIEDVLRVGKSLAAGLTEAHSQGVVHRDVKSANIMLTDKGEVKILDFGLAHHEDATQLTQPGTTLGTVGYMSPEQARGETADERSDIWSLGVVLYECLTGRIPFLGEGASVLEQIKTTEPAPPTALRTGIPIELERAVLRCLEKNPSLRFQHADDFSSEMSRLHRDHESGATVSGPSREASRSRSARGVWVWLIVLMAVVAGVLVVALGNWGNEQGGSPATYTIAVTPFEVFGQKDGADYLGRSMAEAIAVNLTSVKSLHVLPVQLASSLDDEMSGSRSSIGRASNVLRLSGSVTRGPSLVQLRISLVGLKENRLLWGAQESFEAGELPRVAVSLAQRLASHLGLTQPMRYEYFRYVTPSPAMADWPMLAEAVGALQKHDVDRGMPLTEKLIDSYPLEYSAHVMRMVSLIDNQYANQTDESLSKLKEGLVSLERLDPMAPIASIIRAGLADELDRKLELLNPLIARNDLTPSCRAHALRTRGREYSTAGHMDEAIRDLEDALRLDPANPFNYSYAATVLEAAGRMEESLRRGEQHVALDPIWGAHDHALRYGRLGDREQALRYLRQALEAGLTGRAWTEVEDLTFLHDDSDFQALVQQYSQPE